MLVYAYIIINIFNKGNTMSDAISYHYIDEETKEANRRVQVTIDLDIEEWHNMRRVVQQARIKENIPDASMDQIVYFIIMEHGSEIGMAEVLDNEPVSNRPSFTENDARSKKASSLIAKGPVTKPDGVMHFTISNMSNEKTYSIVKRDDTWSCQCKDFSYRKVICKHIKAAKRRLVEWELEKRKQ